MTTFFRRLASAITLPLLLGACTTVSGTPHEAVTREQRQTGLISAADPRAAEAGAEMLRAGGSATDAAIATMLALNVVEPQSSGIGGGGFYVRGAADGAVETIDGRETAPKAAFPGWFLDTKGQPLPFMDAVMSGLSVGVPGNLRLAEEAHRRHGKLAWAKLFEPAIALARDGFRISPRLHNVLETAHDHARADPEVQALYFDQAGEPLAAGALVRNPALAQTLQDIAQQGVDAFYLGANAKAVAARVAAETPHPDGMRESDLAAYSAHERPAVCGTYRGYRICGMGPPSSGATTVFATLKQLEGFDLAALGSTSPVAWHLIAESMRLAYADRELYLADSDFVAVPVAGLADPDYLAARGKLISPVDTMAQVNPGTPPGAGSPLSDGVEPPESGTSHFVAIDKDGNAVSYTSTIEGPFGSGMMVGGYFLNNELTDFSFVPARDSKPVANRVDGGKRPRSSMSPTVIYAPDGRLFMAVGAAGGATIPAQVVRAIIGVIDWKLTASQALSLPVLFAPGDTVYVEQGSTLEAMIPSLEELGHKVAARKLPLKTNAAVRSPNGWTGAADPRSEGEAIIP
ncbi:gamma-glutamyltransferase [Croceicoccus estronivorus]|uniref:gamma-glutamyltransferase n=1 Tax=Croceicoccus estronivorus TaxID=1172626 RepID=UPI00082AB65E|nr:gamma-glutamyltransferase [Croceicoccus estronivorus]OCC23968.1 gamma-glutamyltransferase [Croceicoccus estronivorus]